MTANLSNLTSPQQADRRAVEWRDTVRAFRDRQPARQRPVCNTDAAYDLCSLCPGGPLHPGNLVPRAAALLEEVTKLVAYLEDAPDRGHPMERLEREPEFQTWFDSDDDTPPPPLRDQER